jgi:hypothetical protein
MAASLPLELWQDIIRFLSLLDLSSVDRVSKIWHPIIRDEISYRIKQSLNKGELTVFMECEGFGKTPRDGLLIGKYTQCHLGSLRFQMDGSGPRVQGSSSIRSLKVLLPDVVGNTVQGKRFWFLGVFSTRPQGHTDTFGRYDKLHKNGLDLHHLRFQGFRALEFDHNEEVHRRISEVLLRGGRMIVSLPSNVVLMVSVEGYICEQRRLEGQRENIWCQVDTLNLSYVS